jgi:hypothetical protein
MYQLKALSIGEILDASFTLYRRHFGVFLTIAAVCVGPATGLRIYAATSGGLALHPGILLLFFVLSFLGSFVAAGASLRVISGAYLDREPDVGEALETAVEKMGPLIGAAFGVGLFVTLGFLLLVVPGIIVWCGLALASQVVVLENVSGMDALKRSWELTKGFKGKVFSSGFIVACLITVPAAAIGAIFSGPKGDVVAAVFSLLVTPVFYIVYTILYYDLRVRKEGFDLEVLGRLSGEWTAVAS